ncbi:hypothetical protein GCM10023221_20080 [Luteimicrobium xylanilyticum]
MRDKNRAGSDHGRVRSHRSFAEIVAEVVSTPGPERVVRPGSFNREGELFDPDGGLLVRRGLLTVGGARHEVRRGARLAWEGCGCGGWAGCAPVWVDGPAARSLAADGSPRLRSRRNGAPTWIDLWQGEAGPVVFAHGEVEWGDAFA